MDEITKIHPDGRQTEAEIQTATASHLLASLTSTKIKGRILFIIAF